MDLDNIEKSSISSENDFQRIYKTFNIGENNDGFTKVLNRKSQRKENKQKRATPIIDNKQPWETYQQQGPFRLNFDNLEMGDKEPITKKQKPDKEFDDVIIDTEMELTDQQQISQNAKTAKLPKKDDNQNAKEQEPIGFIGLDEKKILNQKSNEQIQEERSRTVQIINIPLYITPKDIRAVFSRYGEIEEKGFYTRVKGIYQQAYITYKEEDALTIFSKHWSVWAFKE
ncbi:hypothetical protein GLOIN_2v1811259 [Rhizophagus clarus]|uniref:RRM domain-containing protein n=1 Tax=Rhizophagus clarus TaxID=94130 RepID=A0A8H3QY11_9GLOM|nr:hypothetical protein GLOIN_2v1811259 [Rhizophagus clarus]